MTVLPSIALDALARDVRPARVALCGDLIDLVDEDDAVVLGAAERFVLDRVVVDEFFRFLGNEDFHRLAHGDLALFLLFGEHIAEDRAEIDGCAPGNKLHVLRLVLHFRLDDEFIEPSRRGRSS